jgi:gas vesicle protein
VILNVYSYWHNVFCGVFITITKSAVHITKTFKGMKESKLIGGLIAATAIGVAIGLLLAPSSGQQTRKKIIDGSLKLKDDFMSSVDASIESLRKQINSRIDQLAKGGKDVVNHASEKASKVKDM